MIKNKQRVGFQPYVLYRFINIFDSASEIGMRIFLPCSGGHRTMKKAFGRLFWWGLFALFCAPTHVFATDVTIHSETLLRAFERDTQSKDDAAVVPVYEYLKMDIGNAGEPGLSLHLYGWGRLDLADNGYYDDTTEDELVYGYLQYRAQQARFTARLGRQYIFAGVANEAIDGLHISSDLGKYFSGTVYVGQQVALSDENGRSGDSIYGGRIANHVQGIYDVGLSYKKIRNDGDDAEEMTGIDFTTYLPYGINLYGFSTYNQTSNSWAEHSYDLTASFNSLTIHPYFQKFNYEDYFGTGANTGGPFRFLADNNEELSILGTDLTLSAIDSWVFTGKVKHYEYSELYDTSQYYALQTTWTAEGHTQIGGELGYMNGDAAQNDYALLRLFTYWDLPEEQCIISFFSSDLIYVDYDQEIYNEDNSLFISLGAGKKFMEDALEIKLSADYSNDPYFDKEVRGMLTASYQFSTSL
jgi:hypothetical protein